MTQPSGESRRLVWDESEIALALNRIAHQVIESTHGAEDIVLLGIPTRGVPLAHRLGGIISAAAGIPLEVGQLDITMYRDDLRRNPTRAVGATSIPGGTVDGHPVVLVDDVLNSGRTIAAAMDALKDLGRPQVVRLAVLVDRGHRELPIQADYVGKDLPTRNDERVNVRVAEVDGEDAVYIEQEA